MSLVSPGRIDTEKRIQELLAQCEIMPDISAVLAELRQSVKAYEERYGIASERIHDAIEAGELIEDLEVGHWNFDYDLLCRIEDK